MTDVSASPPPTNGLRVTTATVPAEALLRMVTGAIARETFTLAQMRQLNHDVVAQIRLVSEREARIKMTTFDVGNRVRITGSVTPKYLRGTTGVVVGRDVDRIVIDFDFRVGKYHRGVRCSANIVELVSA